MAFRRVHPPVTWVYVDHDVDPPLLVLAHGSDAEEGFPITREITWGIVGALGISTAP